MDNQAMNVTDNIASNLRAWMESTPSLNTIEKVVEKSGCGYGTIRRARNGDGNTTVQNLARIAAAFRRKPEDLLRSPHEQTEVPAALCVREEAMPYHVSRQSPLERELLEIVERMSERGLILLIDQAEQIARRHPREKERSCVISLSEWRQNNMPFDKGI